MCAFPWPSSGMFSRRMIPERLSVVSEEELRQAGFGYRAKYVTGTVMFCNQNQMEVLNGFLRSMDLDTQFGYDTIRVH
ncbi:hypothetical protein CRYUN_Cryun28dG0038200 [Craigia yunnanensis]